MQGEKLQEFTGILDNAHKADAEDQAELAFELLNTIASRFPDEPVAVMQIATDLVADKGLVFVEPLFGHMVKIYPAYLFALLKWMECSLERADWQETLRRGVLARRRFPDASFGYVIAAQALRESGRLNDAEVLFEEAMVRFPADQGAMIQWADCAQRRSDWAEADLRYTKLRGRFPDIDVGYLMASNALANAGLLERRDALLSDAVEVFPAHLKMHTDWMECAASRRDWQEVVRRGAVVRDRFPLSPKGFTGVVAAFHALGRSEQAEMLLEEAASKFPNDAAIRAVGGKDQPPRGLDTDLSGLWNAAERQVELQRLGDALSIIDRALELSPGDARFLRRRVQLAMNSGDHAGALATWRQLASDRSFPQDLCFDLAMTIFKAVSVGDDALELLRYLVRETDTGARNWLPRLAECTPLRPVRPDLIAFAREQLPQLEAGEFLPVTLQILKSSLLVDYTYEDILGFIKNYIAGGRADIAAHLFSLTYTHEKPQAAEAFKTVFDLYIDRWLAEAKPEWFQNFDEVLGYLSFSAVFSHSGYRKLVAACAGNLDLSQLASDRTLQTSKSIVGHLVALASPAKQMGRAPAIVSTMRPLKIAVCVSGQLRGFEQAFPTWTRFGFEGHEVRYFVHTWRHIGRNWFRFWRFTQKRELLWEILRQNESIELLAPRYPKMAAVLIGRSTCDAGELKALYGTDYVVVEDDTLPPLKDKSVPWKMHNKIERAHRLATGSGEEFDLYMRIRPDREVAQGSRSDWHAVLDRSRNERLIFTDRELMYGSRRLSLGDQFAVGSREVMDDYANIFSWTMDYVAAGQTPLDMYPALDNHGSMAHRTFYSGMLSEVVPDLRLGHLYDPVMLTPAELVPLIESDTQDRTLDEFDRELLAACREWVA